MKTDSKELFRTLEPPAGGAERLRSRLRGESPRAFVSPARLGLAAVAASVLLTAILFTVHPDVTNEGGRSEATAASDLLDSPAFDRLLGREFRAVSLRVALNEEPMRAVALADESPNVRLYDLTPEK